MSLLQFRHTCNIVAKLKMFYIFKAKVKGMEQEQCLKIKKIAGLIVIIKMLTG